MLNIKQKIVHRFLHFRVNENGVAAVEFALILPILLLLYLGAVETSRALTYNMRLTNATAAMGDLVARADGSVSEAEIDDYFEAARVIIAPYSADNLTQVITSVHVDEDGDTSVAWSRGYNGGVAHGEGTSYDVPDNIADIAEDSYVIVSESTLNYDPITTFIFANGFTFYKEYFYLPRFGDEIELD